MSLNIGQLAATTLQKYRQTMADNIFKENVLLNHMMENGGIEYEDGGREIVIPLMYAENDTVMAFNGSDVLDTTPQDGIDAAIAQWKMYNVAVSFTKEDELKNSGRSAIIKLIKKKIMQAENSLKSRINKNLFDGAASNAKEITGLQTAVAASGTFEAIDGGANSFWQSYVESSSTALTIAHIRTGRNTVNKGEGGGKCSIMVTTQALHEKYEGLLAATLQMNPTVPSKETKRLGDAGFAALQFAGVPVVWDERCPSGEFYFLNTKNLKLTIHKDANFEVIEKAEPANQHVMIRHIMVMLNTTVDRRASLGKLTAKTI